VPVNTAALLPAPDDRTTALTNATLTQFLSPQFGVVAGKINMLDLAGTEFYGDYRTQFLNAAFNFPNRSRCRHLAGVSSSCRGMTSFCRLWRSAREARRSATMWSKHSTV